MHIDGLLDSVAGLIDNDAALWANASAQQAHVDGLQVVAGALAMNASDQQQQIDGLVVTLDEDGDTAVGLRGSVADLVDIDAALWRNATMQHTLVKVGSIESAMDGLLAADEDMWGNASTQPTSIAGLFSSVNHFSVTVTDWMTAVDSSLLWLMDWLPT